MGEDCGNCEIKSHTTSYEKKSLKGKRCKAKGTEIQALLFRTTREDIATVGRAQPIMLNSEDFTSCEFQADGQYNV